MSKLKAFKLQVNRTACYYTWGEMENSRHIIFALHGYGQLASRIIRKFDRLEDCFIIAPEGLSKFYWNGVAGDVVSSWMTSHNREDEIFDYLAYLNTLYHIFASKMSGKHIHFFGFSQGCATLWRWLEAQQPDIDSICLWAGWLPEEVNYGSMHHYLSGKPIRFIYGLQDEYLTEDRMNIFRNRVAEAQINMEYTSFVGKHKIDRKVLHTWFAGL